MKQFDEVEKNIRSANRMSNAAMWISGLNVAVILLAYLDKIIAFVHWLLSYLH